MGIDCNYQDSTFLTWFQNLILFGCHQFESGRGNCKKYFRAVFHWNLIVNLQVLSTESSSDFDIAAETTFVLQYKNLMMNHCLKPRDLPSKSNEKPL